MVYASFRKRLYAYGYDSLIVTLITIAAGWLLGGIAHAQTTQDIQTLMQAGLLPAGTDERALLTMLNGSMGEMLNISDIMLQIIISALYNSFFLAGTWQATPGKRFCGIYVVNKDASRPTLLQSALRHAISSLSILPGGLGYLSIFFTREKTALHDMLCATRVVVRAQCSIYP